MVKSQLKSKVRKESDFVPPDGGWGWMIVVAAGFSNLSALPFLQQFGLLFRDKFERLGISSSKTTTIINMQSALAACVGLANGPLFRTFSYRQVSLTGSTLLVIALLLTTFSYDFTTYLISFGILYGASYGISSSANALALNTYWKKRRRLATGLSWTTTGLGPMLWPYIITALFSFYGETGAILIICGVSLHAIAGALLLHPVEWHSKTPPKEQEEENLLKPGNIPLEQEKKQDKGYFSQIKNISRFSSQYLFNEDDPANPGYEITDPGMPMMVRANDGYFSQSRQSRSRLSSKEGSAKTSRLNSKKPSMTNLLENRSRKSSTLYLNESKKNSSANLGALAQERDKSKKNSSSNFGALEQDRDMSKKNSSSNLGAQEREPYKPKRKTSITIETQILESEIEDCPTLKAPQDLKADEKDVVEKIDPTEAKHISDRAEQHAGNKSLKSFKIEGQYGAKYNRDNHSNISQKSTKNPEDLDEKKYLKDNHSNQSQRTVKQRRKSNNFNYESDVLKQASMKLEEYLKDKEHEKTEKMKLLINKISETDDEDDVFKEKQVEPANEKEDTVEEQLTLWEKIRIFFDLDLLNDFTFLNLVMGVNLAGFSEMNFSILTPFILGDLGKTKPEVAQFMSLLGLVDISVRFCVPFVAGKIGWENNTFFLVGVMSMAAGRVVLAYNQSYWVVLMIAVLIGFGKGLRTVFVALVIPTHVPLHKLPGATGIQLLSYGIVCIALGPVVGWIKDSASTTVTLYCLNIFTWLTALSWGLEKYIRSRGQAKSDVDIIIDKV